MTIGPKAYLGIGVADPAGARVAQVEANGPAAEAGLSAGDTITAVGDATITSYDVLVDTLATYEPGDQVALQWTDAQRSEPLRNGDARVQSRELTDSRRPQVGLRG